VHSEPAIGFKLGTSAYEKTDSCELGTKQSQPTFCKKYVIIFLSIFLRDENTFASKRLMQGSRPEDSCFVFGAFSSGIQSDDTQNRICFWCHRLSYFGVVSSYYYMFIMNDCQEVKFFMKQLTVGERVRYFREYYRFSQEKLGEIINMSRGNISKIEKNSIPPSNAFLNALKDRFAANPVWVKTGEGEMWISSESYLLRGIELLGKEKMAAGMVKLLRPPEFEDLKRWRDWIRCWSQGFRKR